MRALVTGGAGFIGSHIVDALLARGDHVTVVDSLEPTVHSVSPDYLPRDAAFHRLDVRADGLGPTLQRVDVVFHEAAIVGVGNGDADRERFHDVNVRGTQRLVHALARATHRPRLVLASSMAVYGEGAYDCPTCRASRPGARTAEQLARRRWEPSCPRCATDLTPRAVDETQPFRPETAYAQSKAEQETQALRLGRDHRIPVVALRYHNVYGPRMPRNTPYAGVASLLKARVLAGKPPLVHEDGRQLRDFVHVRDVAAANLLAADAPAADVDGEAFNVGSGRPTTIHELATTLARAAGLGQPIDMPGTFRPGDARHVFGSIAKARRILGYAPGVGVEEGFRAFVTDPMRAPAARSPPA